MQVKTKARFLFFFGLLVLVIGLLPLVKDRLIFLNSIPLEGMPYNLVIAFLGLVALIISLSREWSSYY